MMIIVLEVLIVYLTYSNSNDFVVKLSVLLSSDVKGLSKKGGSMEPSGSAPVLYFNHNHNNSVSKKKLTNKYTKNIWNFQLE